jgi:hypothetical protein
MRLAELVGSVFAGDLFAELKKLPMAPPALREETPGEAVESVLGGRAEEVQLLTVSANSAKKSAVVTILSRAELDPDAVIDKVSETVGDRLVKSGSHAGVDLFGLEGEDEVALAFAGPRLAAFGTAAELKRGLENHAAGRRIAHARALGGALDAAPAEATVTVALAPAGDALASWPFGPGTGEADDVEAVLLSAKAGEALELAVRLTAKTDEGAKELARRAEEELDEARKMYDDMKRDMGPLLAVTALRPLKRLIGSVTISAAGRTASLAMTVRAKAVGVLPAIMMAAGGPMRQSRVASNETAAVAALRVYVAAQNIFHRTDFYGKGELVYANVRDGAGLPDLYEVGGREIKLIDRAFARATGPETPKAGYYFVDIVKGADGRDYDPRIEFGLCAVPARYDRTGRNTLMVDVTGTVYLRDNGGKPVTRYPSEKELAARWVPVGM